MNDKKKLNILFIEDNPGDVRLIRELLNSLHGFSYTIKNIASLNELDSSVLEDSFDIILTDLNIHDSNGIQTFKKVYTLFPNIPIIVQTGISDKELGELAVSEGAQDYLVKGSFDEQLLYKSITYSIERLKLSKSLHAEIIKGEQEKAKVFEEIFENSSFGIYRTTPDGELLLVNPALVKILGFDSVEELKEKNVRDLYKNEKKRDDFKEIMVKQGSVSGYEEKWKKKDGSIIFVQKSSRIVKDENGDILYYEGTVEDISKRKEADEKIFQYNQKLEKLNADKDKFFSTLAHDLTKPFTGLLGLNKMMIEDYDEMDDSERLSLLKEINTASNNGYNLLQDLLHWSRAQMNGLSIKREKVSLRELVEKNLRFANQTAENKNITLKTDIDSSLDVFADYNMIDAVLRNLLSNAIKFTYKRGSILISSSLNDNNVVLTVNDNGSGMEEKVLSNLFKLENSQSTLGTSGEEGTGLGLILCKEYIEKNNGKIWAESEFGEGSKFHFSLPVFESSGKNEKKISVSNI